MRKTVDNDKKQLSIHTACKYREAGLSYEAIAKKMGKAGATVHGYVQAAIKLKQEDYKETAGAIITMELSKLDRLEVALYKNAQKGDVKSINSLLRIQERRSKLLGLDTPIKAEVKVESTIIKVGMPRDLAKNG